MSIFNGQFARSGIPALEGYFSVGITQYVGGDKTNDKPVTALVSIGEPEIVEKKGGRKLHVTRGVILIPTSVPISRDDRWLIIGTIYETEMIGKPQGERVPVYVTDNKREKTKASSK